jgi:hypothetical protein
MNKVPLAVKPAQLIAVPAKRAAKSQRDINPVKTPISGLLKVSVSPKASLTRRTKAPLEAVGANASDVRLDPVEPQTLNMSSTGNSSLTTKGFPKGYPQNKLNKRLKEKSNG